MKCAGHQRGVVPLIVLVRFTDSGMDYSVPDVIGRKMLVGKAISKYLRLK